MVAGVCLHVSWVLARSRDHPQEGGSPIPVFSHTGPRLPKLSTIYQDLDSVSTSYSDLGSVPTSP